MVQEINYKMQVESDGVTVYDEEVSVLARVAEWLDTPAGSVWGSPTWGHNLIQYKHYPLGDDVAAAIENSIALKLPQDLSDVEVSSVLVEESTSDIDLWRITIYIAGISTGVTQEIKL